MESQYQDWDGGQGQESRYASKCRSPSLYTGSTGVAMAMTRSQSSNASSTMASTYSSASRETVDTPTSSYADTQSFQDLEPIGSWDFQAHAQEAIKYTFKSLGWSDNTLLELYNFVVPKNGEAHFALLPNYTITPDTPAVIYLDEPAFPKKNSFPCCYPGGCPKEKDKDPFNRQADLERHYKNVHAEVDQKDNYYCDNGNGKCGRRKNPCTRKDHYRDHLKYYHKEDIGAPKRSKDMSEADWAAEKKRWQSERVISEKWWRCRHCLVKNNVADGWICKCGKACEAERVAARQELLNQTHAQQPKPDNTNPVHEEKECATCRYSGYPGYVWFPEEWVDCPTCVAPNLSNHQSIA